MNSNAFVAIKVVRTEPGLSALEREATIMRKLKGVKGVPCILEFFSCEGTSYLVMELLGKPVLGDLQSKLFPIIRAAKIALKVLKIVKRIHVHGVLHRDIKPQNILFGLDKHRHDPYLVDFGLAKPFPDPIAKKNGRRLSRFIGTRLFSSASAFAGNEQSYSDDLESLCNVLIWLIKGNLPWCHWTGSDYSVEESKKLTATEKEIAQDCPIEVLEYLAYVRGLRFGELPDHAFLIRKLKQLKSRQRSSFLHANYLPTTAEQGHWQGKKKHVRRISTPLPVSTADIVKSGPFPQTEQGQWHEKKKHVRRISTPLPVSTADPTQTTPLLKPPEMSPSLRQRVKQVHDACILPIESCKPGDSSYF
jgi:serine/threonine protein kinase